MELNYAIRLLWKSISTLLCAQCRLISVMFTSAVRIVLAGSCGGTVLVKREGQVKDRITYTVMTRDDPVLTSSLLAVARGHTGLS
jgi:ribosomal protein S27E